MNSREFLETFTPPDSFMGVIAIHPVTGACEGFGYTHATVEAATIWLARHDGWNQYWTPNSLKSRVDKKPTKADVSHMRWVHVDCDDPSEAALERIRNYDPQPTLIVGSGGGFQAFWRIDPPIYVNGNVPQLEVANKVVMKDLAGDPVAWNLDRIMRLPGTTNWPTKTKLAKGRVPVEARVIEHHPDRSYRLEDFGVGSTASANDATVDGAEVTTDLDTLGLPDDLRYAIEHGDREREPFSDRSRAMLWVCGALCRAGVARKTARSILDQHPIGDHGRDQKDSERAFERALDKAYSARDAAMTEMNAVHAFMNLKGRTLIISERTDPETNWTTFEFSSPTDLKLWYQNQHFGRENLAGWWMRQRDRRQYQGIVFSPQRDYPGYYNFWRGFGVLAKPGDCSLYLQMIEVVICSGDTRLARYVIAWMADAVQNPGRRPGVVLVFRGLQGSGKGTTVRRFGKLFGPHFLHLQHAQHLIGRFNAHLAYLLLLFADECFFAGDKQHEGTLKALITEPSFPVEFKGKDVITLPNYVRIMMASNKDWVIPAALDDRRFCVIDVSDRHLKDAAYFGAVEAQMDAGGSEALLHYLLNFDLTGIDLRAIPQTAARSEQQLRSMEPITAFWFKRLNDGAQLQVSDSWADEIATGELYAEFAAEARVSGENRRGLETSFGIQLHKMCPGISKREVLRAAPARSWGNGDDSAEGETARRVKVYRFPTLAECRAQFEQFARMTMEWDSATGAVRERAGDIL